MPDDEELSVVLDGSGPCIAEARHRAAEFLADARLTRRDAVSARQSGLVTLVVSELVTNACKYAPGPLAMDLRIRGEVLEVSVWDGDPVLPMARAAGPGRVGQHGLEIVMAVCEAFEARREDTGKRITARIALTEERAGARRPDPGA
ncbi:ATP-binding protein [Streptomyces sp. NPDC059070]|uniref:ATP-binding protein n=1 Tax=unclassified Streptomyces TaxID=2593676 RepID=UPI0034E2357B